MEFKEYIERAEARLKKDSEVHHDSAEAWALLAIAHELHELNKK